MSDVPVSVLIPCRNEERRIAGCLDSILANRYPHHLLEILVLDGMSDDGTRRIVKDYARRYPFIRLVDNPARIKPAALNIGVGEASADVIMRIDAHAIYDPDYIPLLVRGLAEFGVDNTGGIRLTDRGTGTWSAAIAHAISHPFAVGNAYYRTGVKGDEPRQVDTVFCGCYRRDVFERIGGFNERLIRAQDREFNERLGAAGGRVLLIPAARCTYYPRTSYRHYLRWTFDGAYWLYQSRRFTGVPMASWRNWIPPLFVLWHLLAAGAAVISPPAGLLAGLPILLYWMLNLAVSFRLARAEKNPLLAPAVSLLFATTHYAYGAGALLGALSARVRGKEQVDCRLPLQARSKAA